MQKGSSLETHFHVKLFLGNLASKVVANDITVARCQESIAFRNSLLESRLVHGEPFQRNVLPSLGNAHP